MKIFLDGQEIPYSERLEQKLAGRLIKENLVIRSLKVNSVEMVDAYLGEALAAVGREKTVEILTAPKGELLREAMLDARDYIPKLLGGLPKIRERFFEGDVKAVYALVDAALEGLGWLGLTFQAFLSQGCFPAAERIFTLEYSRLGAVMQELEAALRAKDLDNACDILERQASYFLEKMLPLAGELLQANGILDRA